MKMKLYSWLMVLVMSVIFISCSKNENEPIHVNFPEKQTVETEAGKAIDLTFDMPDGTWELLSECPVWCRLSLGEQKELASVVGTGGKKTIRVHISDDMTDFKGQKKCDLVLKVSGQQQVIATITRSDIATLITVRQNGAVVSANESILIAGDGKASITVSTNFGIPHIQNADWFDVTLNDSIYTLTLNEDVSAKYSKEDGYISFSLDEDGKIGTQTYKVAYSGMDPRSIKIGYYLHKSEGSDISYRVSPFNWQVSADGKTMTAVRPNGEIVTVNEAMPLTVDVLNDKMVFAYSDASGLHEATGKEFFHISQNKSDVQITIDALSLVETSRNATIYAFPEASWNDIKAMAAPDPDDYQSNVLFSFVQKVQSASFELEYYNWYTYEMEEVVITETTDQSLVTQAKAIVPGLTSLYVADINQIPVNNYANNKSYTISLLLDEGEWGLNEADAYRMLQLSTGESVTDRAGFDVLPGLNDRNKWKMDIAQPSSCNYNLLLVINDNNGKFLKALVIKNE